MQMCRVRHLKTGYLQRGSMTFAKDADNAGLWPRDMAEKIAAKHRDDFLNASVHVEPLPWNHDFPLEMPAARRIAVWAVYMAQNKGLDVSPRLIGLYHFRRKADADELATEFKRQNLTVSTWVAMEKWTEHQIRAAQS